MKRAVKKWGKGGGGKEDGEREGEEKIERGQAVL